MIKKIRETFINDSIKELESIENFLLEDHNGDIFDNIVEKVFSTTHNIKGTAPMLGIDSVDHIVKPMEIVFNDLRQGKLLVSPEIIFNTKKLIPVIKSELLEEATNRMNKDDVDRSLRFFDSLILKNA